MAQLAFRAGSGQPTLLWLDSVVTLRSTQQADPAKHDEREDINADQAFMQLTHELGEVDHDWSTYFPPKIGDLVGVTATAARGTIIEKARDGITGAGSMPLIGSLKGGKTVRARPRALDGNTPSMPGAGMDDDERSSFAPPNHRGEEISANVGALLPADDSDDKLVKGEGNVLREGNENVSNTVGILGNREHFALPTESWAYRSAGWRGLYFSGEGRGQGGGGGAGGGRRGERPSSEQWPRKRSTGTTMRGDDRRPDLRQASEAARPWTAPARLFSGWSAADDSLGTINRNLTTRASG